MKFLSSNQLCFLAILLTASNAYAVNNLADYAQLYDALEKGHDVKAIIHIDQCKISDTNLNKSYVKQIGVSASTRMNFNIYSAYAVQVEGERKNTIATSNSILTEHSMFGAVYAYGRLRIFEDNSAEFHAAYYDPKTFTQRAMINYKCRVGNDELGNAGGIVLIDANN